jgi:hypothetical protein
MVKVPVCLTVHDIIRIHEAGTPKQVRDAIHPGSEATCHTPLRVAFPTRLVQVAYRAGNVRVYRCFLRITHQGGSL